MANDAEDRPTAERPLAAEIHLAQVQFLTVAEVAAMMRVSKMTVYRLVRRPVVPGAEAGRRGLPAQRLFRRGLSPRTSRR
jgi:excisionase family DNA binding protein